MKKSLAFLTGICLALSSGLASAVTLNGWALTNPVALDASGLVNGSKNVADLAKKSHALIAPVAKDVSKVLVRGAGGFALSIAVEELLGAVDWVMDPANNQIVYKVPSTEPNAIPTSCQYVYKISSWTHEGPIYGCSLADVGKSWCSSDLVKPGCFATVRGGNEVLVNWECKSDKVCNGYAGTDSSIGFPSKILNPAYDPNGNKEKTLPLDTVSQKIISNAQSGNTDAQVATVAAAQDILNEAENDAEKAKPIVQQLENNSTNCNSDDPDPEDVNCGIEPTEHSKLRASEGRPVGKVVNDIQRARNSDIFIQTSNNRFIVRGVNSREHIVSKDAEHITTVELRTTKQHNKLLNQGDRRYATQAEIDLLKSFIK